jgi:hypothetical protein
MSAIDETADPEALKRPLVRQRRIVRVFQTPIVRELAPIAHGAAEGEFGRHRAHHAPDRR